MIRYGCMLTLTLLTLTVTRVHTDNTVQSLQCMLILCQDHNTNSVINVHYKIFLTWKYHSCLLPKVLSNHCCDLLHWCVVFEANKWIFWVHCDCEIQMIFISGSNVVWFELHRAKKFGVDISSNENWVTNHVSYKSVSFLNIRVYKCFPFRN